MAGNFFYVGHPKQMDVRVDSCCGFKKSFKLFKQKDCLKSQDFINFSDENCLKQVRFFNISRQFLRNLTKQILT